MSVEVVCPDCDTVLERYEDDGPYVERLELCDPCASAQYEAEYEDARYSLAEEWDML